MKAKTTEEAIEIALKELETERANVEIEVISRGKSGILGIGTELAKVRVSLLTNQNNTAKVSSEILETLISKMQVSAVVNIKHANEESVGGPVFEIEGDDSGLLIGHRGTTLKSLQFLVKFISSRKLGEKTHLFIDVSGYQARRYETLASIAKRVATRVATSGLPVALEPMPADERRIIHITLADYQGVHTVSTEIGVNRHVTVEPDQLSTNDKID